MIGHVDSVGRVLIEVKIKASEDVSWQSIEAWIDTGFNGDLVLPSKFVEDLELPQSGTLKAVLADGSEIVLNRFSCVVDWFGEQKEMEVVSNEGQFPLLGFGLLDGHDLKISYREKTVEIN